MTFISTSAREMHSFWGACCCLRALLVAVAIDQRITIKIQPSTSGIWLLDGMKLDMARNPHIKGLIDKLWPVKEGAPPLSIHIDGNIPRASGRFLSSSFGSLGWCAETR